MAKIAVAVLAFAVLGAMETRAQTLYWNTNGAAGTWTDSNWGASASGPFTTAWTTNSNVEFTTNSTLTFATTSIGNVTVDDNQTVTVSNNGTLSMNGTVRTFTIGTNALLTWTGQSVTSSSHAGITKNGPGTLNLGALTFSTTMDGGFTLNSGTVIASGNKAFGNGNMTINGGTIQSSSSKVWAFTNVNIGGNFSLAGTGNDLWQMPINLGATTPTITNSTTSGSRIFAGLISGSPNVGLNFYGTGAAQFYFKNPGNSFSNLITIIGTNGAPEVGFANDGSLGTLPGSVVTNAIVIDGGRWTASDTNGGAVSYTLNSNRGIQVGATPGTSIAVAKSAGFLYYAGVIADKTGASGILAKQGAGLLALGGTNTYSGGTFVGNGTLQVTNGNNLLPVGTTLSLGQPVSANVGTFDLDGNNQQLGGLVSIPGTNNIVTVKNIVTNSAVSTATLAISGGTTNAFGDGSITNSGIIVGAINLVMNGGTQILGDTNSYTGTTTVSNGTLLVNGVIGTNSVTIVGGALGGFGIIGGLVTNQSGGTFAPGAGTNTAGTVLTLNTNLMLLPGSTNIMKISYDNSTNDSVVCGGTITYGGTLVVVTNGVDSAAFTNGQKFTLFITNGASGGYAGSFTTSNLPPLSSGLAWSNSLAVDGSIEVISNATVTPPLAAAFSGTPTNIFVTQSVVFTNISTGNYTNSAWSFGDGNGLTNSGANAASNVTNTYNTSGLFTVSLTVTGSGVANQSTSNNYITVKPKPVLGRPILSGGTNFIFSGTNGLAGVQYSILTSTNVAMALTNWTPLVTNTFNGDGSYNYTNASPTNKAGFFRLKSPP